MTVAAEDDDALLTGVRVLDLGQGIAGPYCTSILQQQGADVIKVEPPQGDWARKMGLHREGFSAVVLAYNAGKSGLCVDATQAAGQAVLARIAAGCDVVVQNFRAGVAERLRLGYDALSVGNPRLVYLSISGFGSEGEWAARPATDNVLQAMSGLMHANRTENGTPQRMGLYLADLATAIYGAQMVCAALLRRAATGRGRHLQLSLLEACCALQASNIADVAFAQDASLPRTATAPSGVFAVRDGHLTLATLDDAMFQRLCVALQMEREAVDARFGSNADRLSQAAVLNPRVAARLAGENLASAEAKLRSADVLFAPVLDYRALVAHPQVVRAGLFGVVQSAGMPDLPLARVPGGNAPSVLSAPRVGEHSLCVLERFGFTQNEVVALQASRVVVPA